MNDYEEIINSAKYNIETQIYRTYQQGYEDGKKASCDCKDNMESEYNRGLNDAWEAAKKIHDCQIPYEVFGLDKTGNGFTYASPLNWGENMSAPEAIAKIKEYEEQQKQFAVGDEVYSEDLDLRFIVTRIYEGRYEGICTDGAAYCPLPDDIKKTGKHTETILKVLAEMRGEE